MEEGATGRGGGVHGGPRGVCGFRVGGVGGGLGKMRRKGGGGGKGGGRGGLHSPRA